jgi:signal peptidase II
MGRSQVRELDNIATEKGSALYWLGLSMLVIVVDQITKYLGTYLPYNQSVYLLPFLNITLEHNQGAAFGFLNETGTLTSWIFVGIAIIASVALCSWLKRLPAGKNALNISLSLILGGTIGNLLDRIFHGYVIDFIHFHAFKWSFPIFNIADTAITMGAILLAITIRRW